MIEEVEILENEQNGEPELPPIDWPEEFKDLYVMLKPKQQKMIRIMAFGMLMGQDEQRLVKRIDSCEWCGKRSYSNDPTRKTVDHSQCRELYGQKLVFAVSARSYYR